MLSFFTGSMSPVRLVMTIAVVMMAYYSISLLLYVLASVHAGRQARRTFQPGTVIIRDTDLLTHFAGYAANSLYGFAGWFLSWAAFQSTTAVANMDNSAAVLLNLAFGVCAVWFAQVALWNCSSAWGVWHNPRLNIVSRYP